MAAERSVTEQAADFLIGLRDRPLDADVAAVARTTCVHALGLAASRSGGLRSNFGTQAKPLHAGMAARNGLEAVSLGRLSRVTSLLR